MKNVSALLADANQALPSTTFNPYIVTLAFATLAIGLFIYWRSRSAASSPFCWLLIGLFPVFLLFSTFPGGTLSGSIMGFSATGAIGAFLFIWWFGNAKTIEAFKIDEMHAENERLQKENQSLRNQLVGAAPEKAPQPISTNTTLSYPLAKMRHKKIALTTGDLLQCQCADIWVSSENTNMQMARFFEQSISAAIRYYGAKRKKNGEVEEDTIALQLKEQMGDMTTVQPATVLVTGSGELEKSNKVKRIFHVASVIGQARKGYRPIDGIEECVTNALREAEKFPDCKTILFPLLGTGTARTAIRMTAERLFSAAVSFLERNSTAAIETVYFLNLTDHQFEICRAILDETENLIKPPIKT